MTHPTLYRYFLAYLLCVSLTLVAYTAASTHALAAGALVALIVLLGLLQLVLQLYYFLHLGQGAGGRLQLALFGFAVGLVIVVAGGTLWIMHHLNTNMTLPQMEQYMQDQTG